MVFLGFWVLFVPYLFVLLVPFLLVWGAWVVFPGFGDLLVPVMFLLVPFLFVLEAWVVFLGFGGFSCSSLVSSERRR